MTTLMRSLRLLVAVIALAALVAVIALPALAADPSSSPASEPTPTASPTAEPVATDGDGTPIPEKPPKPDKPDKPAKTDKTKGEPVTLSGTVGTRTDGDGHTEYTLDTGTAVLVLDAGPSWFFGDDHPLKGHVGKRVTIVGERRAGDDEVDVETVDGVRLREPGKPPWAGGPKVVGERHPGWSAEKAERWEAKRAAKAERHGSSCWPPGHCKQHDDSGSEVAPTH